MSPETISWEHFSKVDIRVGRILEVNDFPEARKPSYKVKVDFGPEIGTRMSSVQARKEYSKADLVDKQVLGVVNFPPKRIANFDSEVLLLGVPLDADGSLSLLEPSRKPAKLGGRVY